MSTASPSPVAFIGLGAMGSAMSLSLIKRGFPLVAFDISTKSLEAFRSGAEQFPNGSNLAAVAASPAAASQDKAIVLFMVANQAHIESALFAPESGAVHALARNATILVTATVSPSYITQLRERLDGELERPDVILVDAPVSGGTARSATGTLTIMASSQRPEDLERADVKAVMNALTDQGKNLYVIPGGLASGTKLKALNQVNCGINITSASEMMGCAAVLGLDTKSFYDFVTTDTDNGTTMSVGEKRDGWTWMFGDRGPRMLGDPKMSSATGIIVKDVGIVLDEAQQRDCVLQLVSRAASVLGAVVQAGMVRDDDSCVVKQYLGSERKDLVTEQSTNTSATERDQSDMAKQIANAYSVVHLMGAYETCVFAEALGLTGQKQVQQWNTIIGGAAGASPIFTRAMQAVFAPTATRNDASLEEKFKVFAQEAGFDGTAKVKDVEQVISLAKAQAYETVMLKEALTWLSKLMSQG